MKVEKKVIEDIVILQLKGEVNFGGGVDELISAVNSTITEGFKKVILVMDDIRYTDSTGVGGFVNAYTLIRRAGGKLILCNLRPKIKDLFSVTKLDEVFTVTDSVEAAIEKFREGPKH